MKEKFKGLKQILLGILALIIYFGMNALFGLIPNWFNFNVDNLPKLIKIIYALSCEIIIIGLLILIFRKTFAINLKDLKLNHQAYFKKYFKYWFLILAIMMVSNLTIILINGGEIAGNEQLVRDMFQKNPIYTFITAVIFAPFIEETVFRLGIRKIISNNFIFVVVSGLLFGGLHILSGYENILDLLYIIPYSAPGMVFAYLLVKSKNIFVPMSLHFIHNGILISLQFITLFFG